MSYLQPTDDAVMKFLSRGIVGPVTMLNLLRFRELADYSGDPQLAPAVAISGRAAFELYIEHTIPFLRETGGDLVYLGSGGDYLIGPAEEGWDMAMLVRQRSVEDFLAFASHEAYLAGIGHRTAALSDSRILPLLDEKI